MSNENKKKERNNNKEESSVIDITDNSSPIKKISNFQFNKNTLNLNSDRNNRELNQTDVKSLKTIDKNKLTLNTHNNIKDNQIKGRLPSLSDLSTFSKDNKYYIYFQKKCSINCKHLYNYIFLFFGVILFIFHLLNIFKIPKFEKKISFIKSIYFIIPEFCCAIFIIIYYIIHFYILHSYLMNHYMIFIIHLIFIFYLIFEIWVFLIKKEFKFTQYINLVFCFFLLFIPFLNLIILNVEKKRNEIALHNIEEIINYTDIKKTKELETKNIDGIYNEKLKEKKVKKINKGIELVEEYNINSKNK